MPFEFEFVCRKLFCPELHLQCRVYWSQWRFLPCLLSRQIQRWCWVSSLHSLRQRQVLHWRWRSSVLNMFGLPIKYHVQCRKQSDHKLFLQHWLYWQRALHSLYCRDLQECNWIILVQTVWNCDLFNNDGINVENELLGLCSRNILINARKRSRRQLPILSCWQIFFVCRQLRVHELQPRQVFNGNW